MPDYVATTDTQVDPDAPVTSQLMYQLRDNPLAIAQGADGAPPILGDSFAGDFRVDTSKYLPVIEVTAADDVTLAAGHERFRNAFSLFNSYVQTTYVIRSYNGSIRFKLESSNLTGDVGLNKNGVLQGTVTLPSGYLDVTIEVGDELEWFNSGGLSEINPDNQTSLTPIETADDGYIPVTPYILSSKRTA